MAILGATARPDSGEEATWQEEATFIGADEVRGWGTRGLGCAMSVSGVGWGGEGPVAA